MATQTQPEQIDAAEGVARNWTTRRRYRLRSETGKATLRETQREIREEIREIRAWLIRLFYVIIGMGGAIIVMLIATLIAAFQR